MCNVAKHDPKEERESHRCKIGRVYLLVCWNPISINDLLKDLSEGVCRYVGRRSDILARHLFNLDSLTFLVAILLNEIELIKKLLSCKGRPHEAIVY